MNVSIPLIGVALVAALTGDRKIANPWAWTYFVFIVGLFIAR